MYASDMDGDGDVDVIAAGYSDNSIVWYEDLDGSSESWSKQTVAANDMVGG